METGKIVVGVDGSDESKTALAWAIEEARLRNAQLDAVYVWQYPMVEAHGLAAATIAPFDNLQHGAAEFVDSIVAEARAGENVHALAVEGHPSQVLVDLCQPEDLLVLGSRGLGGFRELLLGSVSHQCASHAPCPVVIVPTPA